MALRACRELCWRSQETPAACSEAASTSCASQHTRRRSRCRVALASSGCRIRSSGPRFAALPPTPGRVLEDRQKRLHSAIMRIRQHLRETVAPAVQQPVGQDVVVQARARKHGNVVHNVVWPRVQEREMPSTGNLVLKVHHDVPVPHAKTCDIDALNVLILPPGRL
eukprot:scaffold29_cov251-Pinguiococcus_pyrenoidosus.AAC.59